MTLETLPAPPGWAEPSDTAPPRTRGAAGGEARSGVRISVPALAGHVVLIVLAVVSLFPVIWMYLGSIRPQGELFTAGLLSTHFSSASYHAVVASLPLAELFLHTFEMAFLVAAGQCLTSLLAAYAFSVWTFRGRDLLFLVFVGTWLVPFQVTMLPNYVLLAQLGLLNTLAGVIVPQLSSAFAVLLLRQHLRSFPRELLEAARIDGRSSWATLWLVVVPNTGPALAALGILLFVNVWNEYFWPLLVFRTPNSSVLQLAIQSFLSAEATNYGALMAASGLACLPIFALYVVLQRRVVSAFVRSGLR
jgi:multiple sugar transport system permease protein